MTHLLNINDIGIVFAFNLFMISFRYLLFSGTFYLVVWKWKRQSLLNRKIQNGFPDRKKIIHEVKYSLSTFVIFSIVGVLVFIAKKSGYTQIYNEFSKYGWGYFIFSVFAFILIHDTYFYWSHRLMHHKFLFKFMHKVHHESTDPSPWAAFSFHPSEAVVEAMIVPLLVFIMPAHPLAILSFLMYMTFMNALGHLGFELFPKGSTKHWLLQWSNTTTHHNMHHKYFNCNYGLYFNWWDQLMKTNHKFYHQKFDEVTSSDTIDINKENVTV
jgi:sterol desaturase/sphingolipid hydroxylase (fatty acid hydroxylase superfamily)